MALHVELLLESLRRVPLHLQHHHVVSELLLLLQIQDRLPQLLLLLQIQPLGQPPEAPHLAARLRTENTWRLTQQSAPTTSPDAAPNTTLAASKPHKTRRARVLLSLLRVLGLRRGPAHSHLLHHHLLHLLRVCRHPPHIFHCPARPFALFCAAAAKGAKRSHGQTSEAWVAAHARKATVAGKSPEASGGSVSHMMRSDAGSTHETHARHGVEQLEVAAWHFPVHLRNLLLLLLLLLPGPLRRNASRQAPVAHAI